MLNLAKFSLKEVFPLLKNKNFLKLWGAQILGQIGINALHFILVIQVFQQTGNNFVVGILIAVLSLPAIIISPIAGVLADSFNRRDLLMIINIVRLVFTLFIIITFKLPALLLLLAFFVTMASQFFIPTEQSTVPDIVSKDKLFQANSFFTFSLYGSFLIGYTGAGPLLEYAGELTALLVIAGLFLTAALLDKTLPSLGKHLRNNNETILERLYLKRVWQRLITGANYVFNEKLLLVIILQVAFIFAVERAVIALVPSLAQDLLGFSISEISFFMITPLAVGTVIGVLLVNKFKYTKPLVKLISIGLFLDAIVLLLFPLYSNITNWLYQLSGINLTNDTLLRLYIISLAIISGLADVMIIVSAQTFIQRNVSAEIRGRVFASLIMMMNMLGVPLVLIISFLADIINVLLTLVIFGLATLAVTFWGWWFYKSRMFKRTST